jgi:ADP-ribose pyrophosphatase
VKDNRPVWETVSSRYVVNNRWLKLREESCRTPKGDIVEPYYVFEYPTWANCLVVDADMNAILVRQYRHGAKEYVLELVAGWIDPEDPSPEMAIRRELQEELGYVGGEVYQTGITYTNPAYYNNKNYSFLAVGGACTGETKLGIAEDRTLFVERIPLRELWLLAGHSGGDDAPETLQSFHLANLYLAQQFIRSSDKPSVQMLRDTLPAIN